MASWTKLLRPRRPIVDLGVMSLDEAGDVSVIYVQSSSAAATPELNYPIEEAGACEVLPFSVTNSDRVIQRYTSWQTLRVFHRSRISGSWSTWKEVGA